MSSKYLFWGDKKKEKKRRKKIKPRKRMEGKLKKRKKKKTEMNRKENGVGDIQINRIPFSHKKETQNKTKQIKIITINK